jgi:hypothetical protein
VTARGPARLVGWTRPVRPVPAPPTVPVPRGPLEALAEAVADFRASSGGQVGECRDAVVAVAVALADELEEGSR